MSRLIIGSRGSALALWQANWVASALRVALSELETEVRIIRTQGDQTTHLPLDRMPGKGFFVKEIEEALRDGIVDLAVHSMKDVPTELPDGLMIAAVTRREDPRDALVTAEGLGLDELRRGALVGTGSPRRAAQLLASRADLRIQPMRGNVDTRVQQVRDGKMEAVVLAVAGLTRLEVPIPWIPLDPDLCLPAAGQGAVGIETRRDDRHAVDAARRLDHAATAAAVRAEHEFLAGLGGGCRVPIGSLASAEGPDLLRLRGVVAEPNGARILRTEAVGTLAAPERLGQQLARTCVEQGARELLASGHPSEGS